MAIPGVLLTVILLQGGFPGAASDTVTLKEGENLNLHCAFSPPSKSSNSTLQWVNPRGFTIFFNSHRALKDQRYKLLHHSRDELSIQLSNVTVQDAGIYRCFYYSSHFKNKSHNVQILAAPSQPVLEVSQDSGRGIKLSCHTQGCRPQPQISWLLDNGIELQGDTRHRLGADGGKWSTSSTLRILSYSPKVTASCIIQHPALGGHRLVASVPFQDLPSTGCKQPSRISEEGETLSPSENPAVPSSPGNSAGTSPSASPKDAEGSSPSTSPKDPSPSATSKDSEVSNPSASPESPAGTSPSASPEDPKVSNPSASPKDAEVPNPSDNSAGTNPSPSPEDPKVSNPSASPENSGASNPSASPKDAEVPNPSENSAGASPSESPKDPEVSSPSTSPKDPSPSASPENSEASNPSASPKDAEVPNPSENSAGASPSESSKDPEGSSPSTSPKDPSPSASPKAPEVSSSSSPEDPSVPSSAPAQPNPTGVTSNGTEETTTTGNLGGSATSGGFNGAGAAPSGNGTEEEPPRTEVPPAEQNPEAKGRVRKEKNLLLPVLVAALVLVLLIIVLLFLLKLKKAHGVWKRENDVSEQTLESYKSRSNEDSPGHEKNGQAANPRSNMQYVTEGHEETPEKNLETSEKNPETPEKNPSDKNLSISEKMFYCGRETDV